MEVGATALGPFVDRIGAADIREDGRRCGTARFEGLHRLGNQVVDCGRRIVAVPRLT